MIGDDLYKRGYGQPLLKCVTIEQAQYIIKELHEGICGYNSGARTMATRVLRAGYFWPIIEADCQDHIRKCNHVRSMSTLFIRNRNNYIKYYPHGHSLNGEWTSSAPSHPARGK